MAVIQKKKYNLIIYRGLDYPLTLYIPGDFSSYSAVSECRETDSPSSPLICNMGAAMGSYDSLTDKTMISMLVRRTVTGAITQRKGAWSLVLISADDIAEPYASGHVVFVDDPSGSISD